MGSQLYYSSNLEIAGSSSQALGGTAPRVGAPPRVQGLKRRRSSPSPDDASVKRLRTREPLVYHEEDLEAFGEHDAPPETPVGQTPTPVERAQTPVIQRSPTPELNATMSFQGIDDSYVEPGRIPDLNASTSFSGLDLSQLNLALQGPRTRRKALANTPRLSRRQSRQSFSQASSSSALVSAPPTPSSRFTPFSFYEATSSRGITPLSLYDNISVRSSSPAVSIYPETSAKHFLRPTAAKFAFQSDVDEVLGDTLPMSWAQSGSLVFGRGNRVMVKTFDIMSEPATPLVKLKDNHGLLRLLECGDTSFPNNVAVATSKGTIQLWDVTAKKMVRSWHTKPATALSWAGAVLSVGGEKGTIRHFDTRINDSSKMKDETKKVTRHQARITSLAWNHDGRVLASGDAGGVIYCWDSRANQLGPLDVGDQIQRHRRKMQHAGAVKALAWCPWSLKVLSSGDAAEDGSGTIRLWNINEMSPKSPTPDRIELNSQVTSLQWSSQCKELLSTHSIVRAPTESDLWSPWVGTTLKENAIVVHSFPSLSHVTTEYATSSPVLASALAPSGCKVAFAMPGNKEISIWDVWGRRKEPKRQRSMTEGPCGIR